MGVHGETPLVLVAIVSLGCSEEIIIIKRSCFLLVLDFCQSLESGRLAGFPLIAAGNLVLRGKLEPRPRLVSFNRPFYRYSGHFESLISNSYYVMLRGQKLVCTCPPEHHTIVVIWNNEIINGRGIGKKVFNFQFSDEHYRRFHTGIPRGRT